MTTIGRSTDAVTQQCLIRRDLPWHDVGGTATSRDYVSLPRGNRLRAAAERGHRGRGGQRPGNPVGVRRPPPMLPQRRPSMKPPLPVSSGAGGAYICAPASTASLVL